MSLLYPRASAIVLLVTLAGCAHLGLASKAPMETKKDQKITSSLAHPSTEFPIVDNEEVREDLEKVLQSPHSVRRWLAIAARYAPLMRGIFRDYGVPEDLFYVAILESGFDPNAISTKEAAGPWQFVPSTAKKMGMRIDEWVDERRDFEKSTVFAARYFASLYASFNDWHLALAGYNCGGAPVRSALKVCGKVSLWQMEEQGRLSFQANSYVPRVIALVMILKDPVKYGFAPPENVRPFMFDRITVPGGVPLSIVTKTIGVREKELRAMNPELLRGKTPPDASSYEIKIPPGKKLLFLKKFPDELSRYRIIIDIGGVKMKKPGKYM